MRQPRAEEVALVVDEHLGLVLQLAKRRRVDDAIAVALVCRARRRLRLVMQPTARRLGMHGIGRQGGTTHHLVPGVSPASVPASGLVPAITAWLDQAHHGRRAYTGLQSGAIPPYLVAYGTVWPDRAGCGPDRRNCRRRRPTGCVARCGVGRRLQRIPVQLRTG